MPRVKFERWVRHMSNSHVAYRGFAGMDTKVSIQRWKKRRTASLGDQQVPSIRGAVLVPVQLRDVKAGERLLFFLCGYDLLYLYVGVVND